LRGQSMLSKLVLALSSLLFIVFGSAYLSQAFGPARGGYDALDYVRIAEAIDTGEPYDHRQFPIGYPLVLVAFRRAGFSGNMPLVVFNLICLAIGLAATFTMGRRYLGLSSLELACLGTWIVASRVMLDLATIGQPEMAFLMTTSLAVWCLWRAADGGEVRGTWLAAGVALSVASISLRNVGVALIPAVLWTAVAVSREWNMLRRVLLVSQLPLRSEPRPCG